MVGHNYFAVLTFCLPLRQKQDCNYSTQKKGLISWFNIHSITFQVSRYENRETACYCSSAQQYVSNFASNLQCKGTLKMVWKPWTTRHQKQPLQAVSHKRINNLQIIKEWAEFFTLHFTVSFFIPCRPKQLAHNVVCQERTCKRKIKQKNVIRGCNTDKYAHTEQDLDSIIC